jgi:ribosomal protein S18 acetylase RimI-like enzyme
MPGGERASCRGFRCASGLSPTRCPVGKQLFSDRVMAATETSAGEDPNSVRKTVAQIVGSVRAKASMGTCAIGRLIVHPESQGKGIGSKMRGMLADIESRFPDVSKYELFTGSKSEANIRLYQPHGYIITRTQPLSATVSITFLVTASHRWARVGADDCCV